MMKLSAARFCPDCSEIFTNRGSLRPETSCPSCTNRSTVLLSSLFKSNLILFEEMRIINEAQKKEYLKTK
jgi:hypothetical protein